MKLKNFVEATGAPSHTSDDKTLSNRQRFVRDLSSNLVAAAGRGNSKALSLYFAAMPLRDILAVRQALAETEGLGTVVAGLVDGLEHDESRVRFDCAGALDHMADERCAEPLRRLLDDPVPRVRRAAMHSLSCNACKLSPLMYGDDLAPKLIDTALYDPSVRVRRAAVPVLESYCNDARTQQALQTLVSSVRVTRLSHAQRRGC